MALLSRCAIKLLSLMYLWATPNTTVGRQIELIPMREVGQSEECPHLAIQRELPGCHIIVPHLMDRHTGFVAQDLSATKHLGKHCLEMQNLIHDVNHAGILESIVHMFFGQ